MWFTICLSILYCKQLHEKIYVSSDIRSDHAADFLKATVGIDVICNAIMALIAPQQYDAGLVAVQLLKDGAHLHSTHPNLEHWTSVWSGFSIIVNRKTYVHRDLGAAPMDYDFLLSGGTHERCMLDVRDLGLRLSYLPGTGVAIAGKVLRHGVEVWDGGERICQARFMKDAVHDRLGQQRPDWVCHKDYLDLSA
jgi:Oxygenase domain of the 2OGFeDO superfamily